MSFSKDADFCGDPVPRFLPVGDSALTVEFGNEISQDVNDAVRRLDIALAASELPGIVETIPSYRALLICYEPLEISFGELVEALRGLMSSPFSAPSRPCAEWSIPVAYDLPYGEDVAELENLLGLTREALIVAHTEARYQVYMVGFAPGLPYLGGLPPALHVSRRETPRPPVTAGSVLVGGMQCGIASISLPTGWYKVGQTPLRPFELSRQPPFLFRTGDLIRFRPIEVREYNRLIKLSTHDHLALMQTWS